MNHRFSLLLSLLLLLNACLPTASQPTNTLIPSSTAAPTPTNRATLPPVSTPRSLDATISIWHSWNENQVAALDQILRAFQGAYPDVRFNVSYVPAEDIRTRYRQSTYNGSGPTILMGQADWGPELAHEQLITNLSPFVNDEITQALIPPARDLAYFQNQWLGLPYAVSGVVLYRNPSIVAHASQDFETLVTSSLTVTHGGVVGADLERGLIYSGGHIYGLGGTLMDENCKPAFNNETGLQWLGLLNDLKRAGPVELNTHRDLRLFQEGTSGMLIEGTWKRAELVQALGLSNVVIDPWPTASGGALAGFVWAESLYLNVNAVGDEVIASQRLMMYFLTPEVQTLLAEVGFIPSVTSATPRDPLIQQAAIALAGGAAYPICPERTAYWDALAAMLYAVFEQGADPTAALQQAASEIEKKLVELRTSP